MTFFQDKINTRNYEFHAASGEQLIYFVTKLNRFKKYTMQHAIHSPMLKFNYPL